MYLGCRFDPRPQMGHVLGQSIDVSVSHQCFSLPLPPFHSEKEWEMSSGEDESEGVTGVTSFTLHQPFDISSSSGRRGWSLFCSLVSSACEGAVSWSRNACGRSVPRGDTAPALQCPPEPRVQLAQHRQVQGEFARATAHGRGCACTSFSSPW